MFVIASALGKWDHISVSKEHSTPSWDEMDFIKRLFFKDDEVAVQYHVETKDHINIAANCLHLWRPQNQVIPMPPKEYV